MGEAIRDPLTLFPPDDIPAGEYKVIVGWYHLGTGKHLPIAGAGEAVRRDDSFELPQGITISAR